MGKRRLEAAIKEYKEAGKDVEFTVSWLPFQLDANAPVEGINKMEMYAPWGRAPPLGGRALGGSVGWAVRRPGGDHPGRA